MFKKYIYMEGSVDKFKTLPPIYGKVPMRWRDRHHIINGVTYEPTGVDLLTSIDPLGDNSCKAKFQLDGNYTNLISGSITFGPVDSNRVYFDKSGPFNTKSLNFMPQDTTTLSNNLAMSNYIDNSVFSKGITISMFVKMSDNVNLRGQNYGQQWIQLFNLTTDISGATNSTLNSTNRNPALYFDMYNRLYQIGRGVNYDANNQQTPLPYDFMVGGASPEYNGTPNMKTTIYNMFNKWVHVVYTSDLYVEKLFIDGEKVLEVPSNKGMFQIPYGYFVLGSAIESNSTSYKQVELYNRKITDDEVLVLLNQKNKVFTPNNSIVYYEENNKLVYLNCTDDGTILSKGYEDKIGYNSLDKNLLSVDEKGNIVDSYGNNPFAGKVNRILQNTSYTLATMTTGGWGDFNTYEMDMNTELYDYIIMLSNGVKLSNIPQNGVDHGASVNINISGQTLVTMGPIGFNTGANLIATVNNASHHYVTTITPKITQGFVGRFKIVGSIAKYGPTANITNTTWYVNNLIYTSNSAYQPDTLRTHTDNKSDFIIYEIHKDNNTRY